jgi:hypothetical protein
MTDSMTGIIDRLERQKAAIEQALSALRAIETAEAPAPAALASTGPGTRKGGMTAAGRKRVAAAQRKRWAAKKAAANVPDLSPRKAAPRKVRFTPEGRLRLAEAMKRRWAIKRAASAVKKPTRKNAARKAA